MDNVKIIVSGNLYSGENCSDYFRVINLARSPNTRYYLRFLDTDGNTYMDSLNESIKLPTGERVHDAYFIPGSLIAKPGAIVVELMSQSGKSPKVALTQPFKFRVFKSVLTHENTPPPYKTAQTLAQQAIQASKDAADAARRAQEAADGLTGGGADPEAIDNAIEQHDKHNPEAHADIRALIGLANAGISLEILGVGLKIDSEGKLAANTTNVVEAGNPLPISSGGVDDAMGSVAAAIYAITGTPPGE